MSEDIKFSEFRKATGEMMINNIVGWTGTDNVSISRKDLLKNYVSRDELRALVQELIAEFTT